MSDQHSLMIVVCMCVCAPTMSGLCARHRHPQVPGPAHGQAGVRRVRRLGGGAQGVRLLQVRSESGIMLLLPTPNKVACRVWAHPHSCMAVPWDACSAPYLSSLSCCDSRLSCIPCRALTAWHALVPAPLWLTSAPAAPHARSPSSSSGWTATVRR
jgi:hypothetical protein